MTDTPSQQKSQEERLPIPPEGMKVDVSGLVPASVGFNRFVDGEFWVFPWDVVDLTSEDESDG